MNRLSKAHVLVCGMNGTTVEVTENILLQLYFLCAKSHCIVIFTGINYQTVTVHIVLKPAQVAIESAFTLN